MENKEYVLHQNNEMVMKGCPEDIREKIEEMLEEKVGVFVSLQERTDEDYDYSDNSQYAVYLHTDNDSDLSEKALTRLNDDYGLNTYDDEGSDFVIKKLLNIRIEKAQ